jgi:hypothetical protein
MSKFRFLDEKETKVLLQVTEWLDNHFFSQKNKFDEKHFEEYMRVIIDNTREMYEAVYICVNTKPVTVMIYDYVLDIIITDARVDKEAREIVEIAFTTWLINMTDKPFEKIFGWMIEESYRLRKRKRG